MMVSRTLLSKEFRELCDPIKEFIAKYYDDHTTVIITKTEGKLCLDELGNGIAIQPIHLKTGHERAEEELRKKNGRN